MKRLLFLHIAILFSILAWSQTPTVATGLPYECSFEENEDLSAWVLNYNTPTAADQWMIGTAVRSEGKRSLYVSADGFNPNYNKQPNIVAAYLRYKFPDATSPTQIQTFSLSFDWKGVGDPSTARLFVIVCPEEFAFNYPQGNPIYLANVVSENNGRLTNATMMECQQIVGTQKYVCGSETWQNVTLTNDINVQAIDSYNPYVIMFLWVNDNTVDSLSKSSIAIDNVQINRADLKKPQNVDVIPHCEDSTLIVNWDSQGGANQFNVEYRRVGSGSASWRHAGTDLRDGASGYTVTQDGDGTRHCSFIIPRIVEGTYDVRVCGSFNGQLRTGWTYQSMVLVYCPENHCINYIDLYNPSVICTTGYNPEAEKGHNPYETIGPPVDFGPDAEESRHTLHVDPDELDPRTDSMLHTVPTGALAAVRLGNWKSGGEAESITYDIFVDSTNQGILIVRYAIVFENPPGHDTPGSQPRFMLEILDPNGDPIDATCGAAEFTYESGVAAGWNTTKDNKAAWKDWTVVGVDLRRFHNQTIKVRFTVMDCGWVGHYAYAYFTVDCANAHIETESCGDEASINCKAPDGFSYAWYIGDPDAPGNTPIATTQEIGVAPDRQEYTCRLTFVEETRCHFDISTVSAPRFPVPEYKDTIIYDECRSLYKVLKNTSHVMYKLEGSDSHTSEGCEDFYWEFKNLSTGAVTISEAKEPFYLCPTEGDSIEITYTCYIGVDHACDSTRVDTIVARNINSEPTYDHQEYCRSYKIGDEIFTKDTTIVRRLDNFAGCDSVVTLYLKIWPAPEDTYRHDSICSDGYVSIGGIKYNQPVVDKEIFLQGQHGCDSVVYLTLTVNERLQASVEPLAYACPDEEQMQLYFDITAGIYDSLRISFSTPELHDTVIYENVTGVTIPYAANITPGYYKAVFTFYQFCCGEYVEERPIDIRYASTIVEQKWNDVLTVLSPKYNGGFEFVSFQWYKNGQPMEGETHSYIYQPLDFDAEYYVVATRSDSVSIASCPIVPVHHEEQTPYPTIVQAGQRIPMYMERSATIWYYTVSGQLYSTFEMPQGYASLMTPNDRGAYIIKSIDAEGQTKAQVILVE